MVPFKEKVLKYGTPKPSICLSVYLSICLSVYTSIHPEAELAGAFGTSSHPAENAWAKFSLHITDL